MARLKVLTDGLTHERYFQEPATGMNFRAIAGGLAWPSLKRSGCAVVIGETRSRQAAVGIERHDAHILQELQSPDPAELTDWLELMTEDWLVPNWATPLSDRRSYMLDDVNRNRRKLRKPRIRYGDPQGWSGKGEGLLGFYHALVQRRTMSEKTLFFGRKSLCADEIARLNDKETDILEYPAMAALCFALADLDLGRGEKTGRNSDDRLGPADDLGGY